MLRPDTVCKIYLSIGIDINEVGLFSIDERKIRQGNIGHFGFLGHDVLIIRKYWSLNRFIF